jgi:hypothetical protein
MVDITEEEIAAAQERGRIADDREPRATAVRYDRATGQVVVELKHTATFSFPARLAQGLENATDDEIAEVSIIGGGYGLHWETLDVDHAVPALVVGHFGTRRYMSNLVERGIIRAYGNDAAAHEGIRRKAAG